LRLLDLVSGFTVTDICPSLRREKANRQSENLISKKLGVT
jgi:hypothetical protein